MTSRVSITRSRKPAAPCSRNTASGWPARCKSAGIEHHVECDTSERCSSTSAAARPTGGLALAVADVGWFEHRKPLSRDRSRRSFALAAEMPRLLERLAGGLYPWSSECRLRQSTSTAWERQFVLPTGWMKRYPRLGMRPCRGNQSWWNSHPAGFRRGLVTSYPHYLYLHDQLQPDVSVYYNIDDYTLYWPDMAQEIRELPSARPTRGRCDGLRLSAACGRADRGNPASGRCIHSPPHALSTPFLADKTARATGKSTHRPGRASPPVSRLRRLPRRPRGLGASWASSAASFQKRQSWSSGDWGRAGGRALVERVLTISLGPHKRSRAGLATTGGNCAILSGFRRLPIRSA